MSSNYGLIAYCALHSRYVCGASCRCTVCEEASKHAQRSCYVLCQREDTPHSVSTLFTSAPGRAVRREWREDQGRSAGYRSCVMTWTTASWHVEWITYQYRSFFGFPVPCYDQHILVTVARLTTNWCNKRVARNYSPIEMHGVTP